MNRDDTSEATREAAASAVQLAAHLERLMARVDDWFPLEAAGIAAWEDQQRERLHALLRMFDQLYDLVTRKLVRGTLVLSAENITSLSAQNQFRRIEALGGFSADRWIELGATRNMLAHEYPTRPDIQAQRANRAWADLPDLIEGTHAVLRLLRSEGHLGD